MSNESSSAPAPDESTSCRLSQVAPKPQDDSGGSEDGNYGPHVPSKAELLAKLEYLAGALAIGAVPPSTANAIKGIYATMLRHIDDVLPTSAGALSDHEVLKVLRENPELLKFIKPLLTQEQIDLIIREAPHG